MFRGVSNASFIRLSAACLAMGSCLLAAMRPVWAQSPQTLKQFETEAHTGPIEKALVGVEVSGAAVRHGNGIVIRCDGFVVTPQILFGATVNSVTQKVMVTLNPGTSEARRVPARVVGTSAMLRRAFVGRPEPLVVLKIADIHTPALRLLLPDALAEEKQAILAWSEWDATRGNFLPIQTRPVALADAAHRAQSVKNRLAFAQMEAVPIPGAVVVGPDGMGVGLTTSAASAAPDAASFATLNSLTNCITPQSATDAQFADLSSRAVSEETAAPPSTQTEPTTPAQAPKAAGMVKIAGGAVRVNALLREYQADMAQAQDACVVPFLMDRYEVTNVQYHKFWQSVSIEDKQKRRAELYPVAWAGNEPPFPKELDDVPVLGVPLAGAQAYAQWVGKRLPTPYEWCLAAFGSGGGTAMPVWLNRYVADRQATWLRILQAHVEYEQRNPGVHNVGTDGLPGGDPQTALPWLFWYSHETPHVRWSHDTILALAAHLWQDWKDPQHILPVGSRKFDVSPYGVQDMIFNGAEMVMPGQLWPSGDQAASADYYIQVGFPNLTPDAHTALVGRYTSINPHAIHLEVLGSPLCVLPEPMLSRRLRGPVTLGTTDAGVYAAYMNVGAKIREVADMIFPIGTGVVGIAPGPQRQWMEFPFWTVPTRREEAYLLKQRYGSDFPTGGQQMITTMFTDTAWFRLWNATVLPEHREMGRDITNTPLAAPPLSEQQNPTSATYLVPGGFRCVR